MIKIPSTVCAGLLQFDVKSGEIDANLSSVVDGIARLQKKGAQLAVLPELWSCGFDIPRLHAHAERTPQIIETLRGLAAGHRMIIAGSLPETSDGRVYNTLFVVDQDGTIAGRYRKIHLFFYNDEDKAFAPGDRAVVCKTSAGPIGLMICYDLRFPELCRTLALSGARLVLVSAQWPEARIHHWDTLLAARAIENQIFIAAGNRVGTDKDLIFNGHSQIISPDGAVLTRTMNQGAEETAQIDFTETDILRARFDCLKERVPAAYLV